MNMVIEILWFIFWAVVLSILIGITACAQLAIYKAVDVLLNRKSQ